MAQEMIPVCHEAGLRWVKLLILCWHLSVGDYWAAYGTEQRLEVRWTASADLNTVC